MKKELTKKQMELIKDNLQAFENNFQEVAIIKEISGKGFYVYQDEKLDNYIQYCYDIHYLNGWLYGAVQAKCKVIKIK